MANLEIDGGWTASADAWIRGMQQGDPNRTLLLDAVMLELCGDVSGLRVLDIGCGEGRFCRMLTQRGASVTGFDIVEKLVAFADDSRVGDEAYVVANAEALPFAGAVFDLAVSYITLPDIPGFRSAISEAARILRPGGRLLVANLSFVTASAGWLRDEDGKRLFHRVDRYLEERSQVFEWGDGLRIVNWHRPLSAYMQAYLGAGLILRRFLEPMPADDSLKDDPYFEDWYRVPNFDVMLWEKPS